MKLNWKDIIERVVWTFVQAFLGALVIMPNLPSNEEWKAMLIPAIAAGLSAIKNVILDIARQKLAEKDKMDDEGDA